MTEEIKEILDKLKYIVDFSIIEHDTSFNSDNVEENVCLLTSNECQLLLDCITNLQQENEYLKKQNDEKTRIGVADHKYASQMEDKVILLQQENERLKEKLENKLTPEELVNMLNQELVRQNKCYKSRCEKAMELINKNSNYPTYYLTGNIVKELKNILNGSEKEIERERMEHWAPSPLYLTELLGKLKQLKESGNNE